MDQTFLWLFQLYLIFNQFCASNGLMTDWSKFEILSELESPYFVPLTKTLSVFIAERSSFSSIRAIS